MLRSHLFFKMVQETWLAKTRKNHKFLELTKDDEENMNRGGTCNIFDLIDELKFAFKDDKEIQERVLMHLRPDCVLTNDPNRKKLELRFSLLKITNKIAKTGKDPRWLYHQLDADGNGTCK